MAREYRIDMLTCGLRALGIMARYAPVDIDNLARLSGTTSRQALTLIETFVQQGYVEQLADTASYVLTDLALPLVPAHQGDLPSRSVH